MKSEHLEKWKSYHWFNFGKTLSDPHPLFHSSQMHTLQETLSLSLFPYLYIIVVYAFKIELLFSVKI